MADLSGQAQLEDWYAKIRQLVLDNEITRAVELLDSLDHAASRITILSRFAHALAHTFASDRAFESARSHARALVLDLALTRDLDRAYTRESALERAVTHALDLALALDFALALARDLEQALPRNIVGTLEESQVFTQFIITALNRETMEMDINTVVFVDTPRLTTQLLAEEVIPYLNAVIELQQLLTEMQGKTFFEPAI
ncbi:MAG: hypothetical protein ABI835_17030, partial [Chloroflexota bacterium]